MRAHFGIFDFFSFKLKGHINGSDFHLKKSVFNL